MEEYFGVVSKYSTSSIILVRNPGIVTTPPHNNTDPASSHLVSTGH